MGINYYISFIPCLVLPIALGIWWIIMKLGHDKRWFVMPGYYISRNFYFALPPFLVGFLFVVWGIALIGQDINNTTGEYILFIAFGFYGLAFVFAYLEPDWLAPEWYRWLKREHGHILSLLAQEANQLGRAEWLKQVQTQEDLEAWVVKVQRKHGLE